jgi:hypothetical protein
MKHPLIITGLAGLLLASSCEKHDLLLKERADVEAAIKQGSDDLLALDNKIFTFGANPESAAINLERLNAGWVQKNAQLEQEMALLSKKCSDGEDELKKLRPKLDSYKARFVR